MSETTMIQIDETASRYTGCLRSPELLPLRSFADRTLLSEQELGCVLTEHPEHQGEQAGPLVIEGLVERTAIPVPSDASRSARPSHKAMREAPTATKPPITGVKEGFCRCRDGPATAYTALKKNQMHVCTDLVAGDHDTNNTRMNPHDQRVITMKTDSKKKTRTTAVQAAAAQLAKRSTPNPLKWHGGKHYLAKWIISKMPPRAKNSSAPATDDHGWVHYVEPYFGGGAVMLQHEPEGISEMVNDLNGMLMNFYQVMQSEKLFVKFKRIIQATPFSKQQFEDAEQVLVKWARQKKRPLNVEAAAAFFIRNRQSRQGLMKDFATLSRNRTRRGRNEQVASWMTAIEGLEEFCERLKRVAIDNDDALEVIKREDGPRTLFYLDPPYLHETRVTTADYEHEMSPADHEKLLELLSGLEGRFLLSGYNSALYLKFAAANGWHCVTRAIDNKASSAKTKERKVECLWLNYDPASGKDGQDVMDEVKPVEGGGIVEAA